MVLWDPEGLVRPRLFVFGIHDGLPVIDAKSLPGTKPYLPLIIPKNALNNVDGQAINCCELCETRTIIAVDAMMFC